MKKRKLICYAFIHSLAADVWLSATARCKDRGFSEPIFFGPKPIGCRISWPEKKNIRALPGLVFRA